MLSPFASAELLSDDCQQMVAEFFWGPNRVGHVRSDEQRLHIIQLAAALLPSQDLRERGAAALLREPLILENTNNDETASIFQQVLQK